MIGDQLSDVRNLRLTRDVDLVLRLDPANVRRGMKAMLEIGYQMSIPAKPEDLANPEMRENLASEQRDDYPETLE